MIEELWTEVDDLEEENSSLQEKLTKCEQECRPTLETWFDPDYTGPNYELSENNTVVESLPEKQKQKEHNVTESDIFKMIESRIDTVIHSEAYNSQ